MFVVGITGGSGAGKTVVAERLLAHFGPGRAVIVSQDSYYCDHSHLPPEKRQDGNFDEPSAVELALLVEHIDRLRQGQCVEVPIYDFATHTRIGKQAVAPHEIVIIDGLFVLTDDDVRKRLDLKVFVDAPEEQRVRRRIDRDIRERGRTADEVMQRLTETVLPMHRLHVEPGRRHADLIVDGCGNAQDEAARVIREIERRARS